MSGVARLKNTDRFSVVIPAGGTLNVDTIKFADLTSQNYKITLYNEAEGKFKSLSMDTIKTSSDVIDSVSAILGSSLKVTVNFVLIAPDAFLVMTNTESFEVTVDVIKTY